MEMICAMVHQLTRELSPEQIKESGFETYFVDHTNGVYPIAASGMPWTAAYIQSKGDVITDLHEDLAAEGTTVKEQPDITTSDKALLHAGFRAFRVLVQKSPPATS